MKVSNSNSNASVLCQKKGGLLPLGRRKRCCSKQGNLSISGSCSQVIEMVELKWNKKLMLGQHYCCILPDCQLSRR